jgi:hypothetical protein
MSVLIQSFRPMHRNTLRGFARAQFPSGMVLDEIAIHVGANGNAWASPPGRPWLDTNGNAIRDARGRIRYAVLITFGSANIRDNWSSQIIRAIELKYPDLLHGMADQAA